MIPADAEKVMEMLRDPESTLARQYARWRNMGITKTLMDLMYYLSNPDVCVENLVAIPGTGGDAACALVGYTTGRSQCLTELLTLGGDVEAGMVDGDESFEEEE